MRLVSTLASLSILAAYGCSVPVEDAVQSSAEITSPGEMTTMKLTHDTVSVAWNKSALDAIALTNAGPTVAARAFAELHTAMFDAWTAYTKDADPFEPGVVRQASALRTDANKKLAMSFAAYRVLVDLFPTQEPAFRTRLAQLGGNPSNTSTAQTSAPGVGNAAAEAVITKRHQDASNQLGDITPGAYSDFTGYSPINTPAAINDPNRWQPLTVKGVDQIFVTPHWQNVLPFALGDATAFRPAPPPQFGSSQYAKQAKELVDISANLDDRAKVIAEYWADGPGTAQSPGHWMRFAQDVSARDGDSTDDDAKLFFTLGNAMLDTSIAVWESKRFYDAERPITAIHALFAGKQIFAWGGVGKGTRKIDGAKWQPYDRADEITPASPEYASEESAFAFAAASILERFTGSDTFGASVVVPRKSSKVEPGITPRHDERLCWRTFEDAASQAGRAQKLRGVHFDGSDKAGRAIGKSIGSETWKAALVFFKDAPEHCRHRAPRCNCGNDDRD